VYHVTARDVAMYLCREVKAKGLRGIGCLLGVKSSAVRLAAKRVRQQMVADAGFRRRLLAVKDSLVKISMT
jgi:chromosomal replication initiation ATPase DnaA